MASAAPRVTTVFRACVVSAIREGEALMQQLVTTTRSALTTQEEKTRDLAERALAAQALRLLAQHEAALVKAYPMALLEVFADGPSQPRPRAAQAGSQDTGMDFGELVLMDDAEVLAQVELARAQQVALHASDAALTELNTLVSSAQGLVSVQPERNPLRPENYIRALQRVVADTGVASEMRSLWMAQMRELLGVQLVGVYQRTMHQLREHGVQPVGYAVAGMAGLAGMYRAAQAGVADAGSSLGSLGGGYAPSMHGGAGSRYGVVGTDWGRAVSGGMPLTSQAEEALLTVGMLRQMLAGAVEPWGSDGAQHGVAASAFLPAPLDAMAGTFAHGPMTPEAAEALHDMAELERLVGRLANTAGPGGLAPSGRALDVAYGASPALSAPEHTAQDVVSRMMELIAQDVRLLAPMQHAVQSLAPALKQLVAHDTQFFTDEQHPARRLLDELTQRSLAFESEDEPRFGRFMRLVNEVVGHLATARIDSAAPFERVLHALEKAWALQERQRSERAQMREREAHEREQREQRQQQLALQFAQLDGAADAPQDLRDFVTGVWARVVAQARPEGGSSDDTSPGDAHAYLSVAPLLLLCGQDALLRAEPERLAGEIADALPLVVQGLQGIGHPDGQIAQVQTRLAGLQQRAEDYAAAAPLRPVPAAPMAPALPAASGTPGTPAAPEATPQWPAAEQAAARAPAPPVQEARPEVAGAPEPLAAASATGAAMPLGQWVEIVTRQSTVHTQLTWSSPQHTLFLFTAADGSTQSMTRRMVDRWAAEGAFRLLSGAPGALPRKR